MNLRFIVVSLALMTSLADVADAAWDGLSDRFSRTAAKEMREALKDFPEACDTTIEVAEKCNVELERDSILPRFPLPEGETEESWFRHQCEVGLIRRYGEGKATTECGCPRERVRP